MSLKSVIRSILNSVGYDLVNFSPAFHPVARLTNFIRQKEIDLVLDVGANTGQFAHELRRKNDYRGRIISFEPLSAAFRALEATSRPDPLWDVHHYGLGENDTTFDIHIAGNSASSSFLEMGQTHVQAAPESAYVGVEKAKIHRLDTVFPDLRRGAKNILLKIDTQGYEEHVLRGAPESLKTIDTLLLELSLTELYQGGPLFLDLCAKLRTMGFELFSITNGFADAKTGQVLQVDGLFVRVR